MIPVTSVRAVGISSTSECCDPADLVARPSAVIGCAFWSGTDALQHLGEQTFNTASAPNAVPGACGNCKLADVVHRIKVQELGLAIDEEGDL